MCSDLIMWPPASKIRYREDTCLIFSQCRLYTSIIEDNSSYLFIYFSRILCSPHSRQRAKLFLQSSAPTFACGRGGGESQFGRADRHCGSLGIYVLCGTASLENLPTHILQKIRKTLKSVRAIFNVFSRYRSMPGEHMKNR